MLSKLNFKAAYGGYVKKILNSNKPLKEAMGEAIGGEFKAFGIIEREMLKYYGLSDNSYLIDVGCGSGRLAIPAAEMRNLRYLGTDIVPALVNFARQNANRPDWSFKVVENLRIPEADGQADFVCFFSVFTHLLHEQSYIYLEESKRVLKPGGKIVLSFLEFHSPSHWPIFAKTIQDAKESNGHPLNVFIERNALSAWANQLGLEVLEIRDGHDAFVPLPEPVTLDGGGKMENFGLLGQSICVLGKPT